MQGVQNGDSQILLSPPAQDLEILIVPTDIVTEPSWSVGKLPALGWNTWNAYRCGKHILRTTKAHI